MSPHDVLFGSSRPRARIVMITAITPSENASRRSVVRSNGASDLVGSLIAAMIGGLAPRAARWKDEPHGRSRSARAEGAAETARRLADLCDRAHRGHVGAAELRPRRRVLP